MTPPPSTGGPAVAGGPRIAVGLGRRRATTPVPGAAHRRCQGGQAAVEVALLLPVLALLLLAVAQVALVARDQVLVVHAAREGARAAAVDPAPDAARRAALSGSGLKSDHLSVDKGPGPAPGTVAVAVRYRAPTDVAVVGALLPDVLLSAKAAMWVEW